MIVGTICMSHSPLIETNTAPFDKEEAFRNAIEQAASLVRDIKPELTIIFFPDHMNGFFYNLMPAFAVGICARSIGDFGTIPGDLNIPEDKALDCATACLSDGVDVSVSYDMTMDHGGVQPIELLSKFYTLSPCIPVFINCAMAPRPTMTRVKALGKAVTDWAERQPERILVIGSGGLSHDPPLPALGNSSALIRKRLIEGKPLSHAERMKRQHQVLSEGMLLAAGKSELKPINESWDRDVLAALTVLDFSVLEGLSDEEITQKAGRGAHEMRTWFAALSGVSGAGEYQKRVSFYEPVHEWITGMGILAWEHIKPANDQSV